MRRGGRGSGVLIGGILVVAAVLGVGVISAPEQVLPFTLELIVLSLITWWAIRLEGDEDSRRWLSRILLVALVVRVGLATAIHFWLDPYLFAPDAYTYEYYGRAIASHWATGEPLSQRIQGEWQVLYYYINGFFFYVFGESPLGPVVLNIFAGLWTTIAVYYLGWRLLGERVGKTAALLTAFFPSLVLWSVLNIRDALTTALVVGVGALALRLYRRFHPGEMFLLLAGLVVLSALRDYMGILVLGGLAVGMVTVIRRGRMGLTFALGLVLALFGTFVMTNLGVMDRISLSAPLETVTAYRSDLVRGAGSAYGQMLDTSSPTQALLSLPIGLTFFLFAPFPWDLSSLLQVLTLPEVLLWYALVPFTVVGAWTAVKEGPADVMVPIAILVVVMCSYALVEGNVGTAYRHRAQLMPLFFLLTATGFERLRRAREARRRREAERRRRARERYPGSEVPA